MIQELGNHLWQSTLFAGVVALLTLALRRNRAAVRHALWLAASVKFLVPFSLLIGIGGRVEWRTAPAVVQPQVSSVMAQISQPFVATVPASAREPGTKAPSRVPAVLLGVWLCGFAANTLAWWRRWRRVRAILRVASPLHFNLPIRVMSSPARLEPGVFGVLRPRLLLPEGITERLTPAQLEAIIAHELCHVRRRDNLVAALHMVVEALFWFHPLVWWIEARLVEERERACDEEVLRTVGDPQDYAEGILNVCKFYLESPLVCVSGVTGSPLKSRVEAIMINRPGHGLSLGRKLLLAVAGVSAVAVPLVVGVLNAPLSRAQASAPVSFEAASIKPNHLGGGHEHVNWTPGRLTASMTTKVLIEQAFGIKDFQVSGGPAWLDEENYDILATTGTPVNLTPKVLEPYLKSLLAERFQFKYHRGTKELPVYSLTTAKNGPKLTPHTGTGMNSGIDSQGNAGRVTMHGTQLSMAPFADYLARKLDRTVIDNTGLKGEFDLKLEWSTDQSPESTGPSIFTALQEQLGLRLASTKGPVEILIIDSVEKPSEN
jgi:uncharacterized protein (TIGR03435 family)